MSRPLRWVFTMIGAALIFPPILTRAQENVPPPLQHEDDYSLTHAEPIKIPARRAKLPLLVYGESAGQEGTFVASGYMGDNSSLRVKTVVTSAPVEGGKPGRQALRVQYLGRDGARELPYGRDGWVGVYWQTPANNWAKVKGAGYNLSQANRLTFWARGEHGGEVIAEFKVGGLTGPYPDTDSASLPSVRLSPQWKKYTVDLSKKDLRHISGAFAFILRRQDNPRGAAFYLDEIRFEGEEPASEPAAVASAPAAGAITKSTPTALTTPVLRRDIVVSVSFPSAKTAFEVDGREALEQALAAALKYPTSVISVEGHTDSTGPAELNQRLSYERARAVSDYLEQHGVAHSRLTVNGFGGMHPHASNTTPEGRLLNRRVEIRIRARDDLK